MYLCRKYICQSLMMMWYDVIELFKSSGNFRVLGVQMASEGSGRGRSLFRTEGLPLPLIHGFFLRCLKVTNFQETRLLLKADINWDKASGLRIPYILTVESGTTQIV